MVGPLDASRRMPAESVRLPETRVWLVFGMRAASAISGHRRAAPEAMAWTLARPVPVVGVMRTALVRTRARCRSWWCGG